MSEKAKGTFTAAAWDEQTHRELDGDSKLNKASVTQEFTGDFEGSGAWDAVLFCDQDGRSSYTGLQHFTGTLGGRSGSFVARADGAFDGTEARSEWTVLPGSGTGDLEGLRGTGVASATSTPPGSYTFDYELG